MLHGAFPVADASQRALAADTISVNVRHKLHCVNAEQLKDIPAQWSHDQQPGEIMPYVYKPVDNLHNKP